MFKQQPIIHGLIYSLELVGPDLIARSSDPIFNADDYLRIGNMFFLAIGQGNYRNYGLFELPVPGYSQLHALVYAFDVDDQLNADYRNEHHIYCLYVLIFPKELRGCLPHIIYIEELIRWTLNTYPTIDKLKTKNLFTTIIDLLTGYIPNDSGCLNTNLVKREKSTIITI